MGVCGSVVLFYGRSVLRRPSGRLWLRRPLLSVFVSPSPLFGVLGQCSYLWTLMAPSSSSMEFSSSVLRLPKNPEYRREPAGTRRRYRFRGSATDSGIMQVWRAFRGNVLIYGRLLLRRPRSRGFVPPLTVGDFAFCLSLLLVYMCSALAKSLLGEHTSPNEEFTSDSLQLVLLGRGWFSSEELF